MLLLMVQDIVLNEMPSFYLDIETTGLDPISSKIITIQYQELERGTGKPVSELKILKEWELDLPVMLNKFANDVNIYDDYPFTFIPVGYNLDFESRFIKYYSNKYLLREIDISLRPKIDLFGVGILMNGGEFKGARLDSFTTKLAPGSAIPNWYANNEYDLIEDYIIKETKAFTDWYQQLHIELPLLNMRLQNETL